MTEPRFKSAKKRAKPAAYTKRCDALFSKLIRSRGACELETCGQTFDLQCAHGFSRGYRAVRWDERNAFALCRADHMYFTHRPLEWDDWLVAKWGEGLYVAMRTLAKNGANPVPKDELERLKARAEVLGIAA